MGVTDGEIFAPLLPYRWGPSWRAVLQNYPKRAMAAMEKQEKVIDYPPTPEPQMLHGFVVTLSAWELIRKPLVREYFRAEAVVTDPRNNVLLQQYLIVDPFDLKITWGGLTSKIERAMDDALRLGYHLWDGHHEE